MTRRYNAPLLLLLVLAAGCHTSTPATPSTQPASTAQKASTSSQLPSAAVTIPPENLAKAGIQYAPVVIKTLPLTITVTGQIAMDEKQTNHLGALADGRVEAVQVLPGDTVRRGQTLATIHSHVVHETVAALTQAFAAVRRQKSNVGYATQLVERYAHLYSIQAASLEEKQRSEQDLAQAQKDLTDAEATLIAEREHLAEILQVAPDSLHPDNLYQRELVPVRALSDGIVIARNITPGQVVATGEELFVISNLTTVWANAALNEKDVPKVQIGRSAVVTLHSADDVSFSGKVMMIGDLVDPQTRTLPVRILVRNAATKLRPGMFVTTAIDGGETHASVFVPQEALQDVNGYRVVFTTQNGTSFYAVAIKTGAKSNGLVEVTEGLKPGDNVVVRGAFMVKGEMLKGSVGEG